jgi:excisionase family DNA binding protein
MEGKLWSARSAYKYLGIGKDAFAAAVEEGEIPFRRVGSRKKFDKDDLDEWANQKEKTKKLRSACIKKARFGTPIFPLRSIGSGGVCDLGEVLARATMQKHKSVASS